VENVEVIANPEQKVFYWLEANVCTHSKWVLFTAVYQDNLIMSGLAASWQEAERFVPELAKLVQKHLAGCSLEENREANRQAIEEFQDYFQNRRQSFTLEILPLGTDFQKRVWQELCKIPYGETLSYAEVAAKVGCPLGQRAVGMANNKNPLGIIVPCHRVIGKKGDLTGYAGGLDIKRMLLELEKTGKTE
jgi:O-6-methylguanine DNA methyltransferase